MDSAAVEAPVMADQAAAKNAAPKRMEAAPPKAVAALSPLVREQTAAKTNVPMEKVANEADFSAKGVAGGSATRIVAPAPRIDSVALGASVADVRLRAADAGNARQAFALTKADLKVLRTDSTVFGKKTTYQSLSGKEVVLTEPPKMDTQLSEVIVTGVAVTGAAESRKAAPASKPTAADKPVSPAPPPAPAPVPASVPASPPTAQLQEKEGTVHTISWGVIGKGRYTLSGPVPVAELEAIKAILLQKKL